MWFVSPWIYVHIYSVYMQQWSWRKWRRGWRCGLCPPPSSSSRRRSASSISASSSPDRPSKRGRGRGRGGQVSKRPKLSARVSDPQERWRTKDEPDVEPPTPQFEPKHTPGPRIDTTADWSPLSLFKLFFSSSTLHTIINNTNANAVRRLAQGSRYRGDRRRMASVSHPSWTWWGLISLEKDTIFMLITFTQVHAFLVFFWKITRQLVAPSGQTESPYHDTSKMSLLLVSPPPPLYIVAFVALFYSLFALCL